MDVVSHASRSSASINQAELRESFADYYFKPEAIAVNKKLLTLQAASDAAVVSTKGKGKARAVDPDEGIQAADDPKAALLKYIQARKEIVINARVVRS